MFHITRVYKNNTYTPVIHSLWPTLTPGKRFRAAQITIMPLVCICQTLEARDKTDEKYRFLHLLKTTMKHTIKKNTHTLASDSVMKTKEPDSVPGSEQNKNMFALPLPAPTRTRINSAYPGWHERCVAKRFVTVRRADQFRQECCTGDSDGERSGQQEAEESGVDSFASSRDGEQRRGTKRDWRTKRRSEILPEQLQCKSEYHRFQFAII